MKKSNKFIFNYLAAIILLTVFLCISANRETFAKNSKAKPLAKPIVGLNMEVRGDNPTVCKISTTYVRAILNSGGIPILIPPMPEEELSSLFTKLDGVLLIGGRDYPASIYGKKNHKSIIKMHPKRTSLDSNLAKLVLKNGKIPFLGVCAGAQILNIQSGGTLVRDIPSKFPNSKKLHAGAEGWQSGSNIHAVELNSSSKISKIYNKTKIKVPSSHHQCVDRIGKGLKVTGHAPDGMTESFESSSKDRFIVGVQWHPEQDLKNNHKLFDEFINQCLQFKSTKNSMSKKDSLAKAKN